MQEGAKKFMIWTVIIVAVIFFREPIISTARSVFAEVESWWGGVETKPRQSQRAEELNQSLDIGVQQSSDKE